MTFRALVIGTLTLTATRVPRAADGPGTVHLRLPFASKQAAEPDEEREQRKP